MEKSPANVVRPGSAGFTLMELLVVIAIIGVLVAIGIPVFRAQLERSREATDAANIRSAYAEVMAACLEDDRDSAFWNGALWTSGDIELLQQQYDWQDAQFVESLGNIATIVGMPQAGGTATVEHDVQRNATTIRFYSQGGNVLGQHMRYALRTRWTYGNGSGTNGTGKYLYYTTEGAGWKTTTVTDLIDLKGGTTLTFADTKGVAGLDPNGHYSVGVYTLDPQDKNGEGNFKVLDDSGEKMLGGSQEVTFDTHANGGRDVKVAIQLFKHPNGSTGSRPVDLSDQEVAALLSLLRFE